MMLVFLLSIFSLQVCRGGFNDLEAPGQTQPQASFVFYFDPFSNRECWYWQR